MEWVEKAIREEYQRGRAVHITALIFFQYLIAFSVAFNCSLVFFKETSKDLISANNDSFIFFKLLICAFNMVLTSFLFKIYKAKKEKDSII